MAEEFTARFRVDVSDLKKGITEATRQIKTANATFKAETAGMENWSKDADGLASKLRSLDKVLNGQKAVLSSYEQQLERQKQAYTENGNRADQLKAKLQELSNSGVKRTDEAYKDLEYSLRNIVKEQQNNAKASEDLKLKILNQKAAVGQTEAQIRKYESAQESLEKEYTSLTSKIEKQESELKQLKTDYANIVVAEGKNSASAKNLAKEIRELSADLNRNQSELEQGKAAADRLDASLDDLSNDSGKAGGGFTVFKGALADLISSGIQMATSAIADFARQTIETGKNFEASMSNVASLSGATGEELELLTNTAREYGSSTQYSASQAADALGFMALAGWDAEKSASELGGVLNLAAASGMDLAQSSDMVTDYLSAFSNTSMTASEFADKLAYAQANSNTSAEQLGEAYKNSAANLNAAGQSADTVTAILSAMANQGTKGARAGTQVSAMMRDLTANMEEGAVSINGVAVAIQDENGDYRDLIDIIKDVDKATKGLGKAEKASALSSVFTADSIKGLNLVLNNGIENTEAFRNELKDCDGAAEAMAKTMNDNLSGDIKTMNSAFEELQLTIYDSANAPLRELVQIIGKDLLPAFADMIKGVSGSGKRVGKAIGDLISTGVNTIVQGLPEFIKMGINIVSSIISGIIKAIPSLVKALPDILFAVVDGIKDAIQEIGSVIAEEIFGIEDVSKHATEAILEQNEAIYAYADALANTEPQIADYNKLLSDQGNTLSDLDSKTEEVESSITEVLKTALSEQRGLREEDIKSIEGYMEDLQRLNEEKLQIYRQNQISELKKLQLESGEITQDTAAQYNANAKAALDEANKYTEDAYTNQLSIIEQKNSAGYYKNQEAYQNDLNLAKTSHDEQIAENERYYNEAMGIIGQKSIDWVQQDAETWAKLAEQMSAFNNQTESGFQNFIIDANDWLGNFKGTKDEYLTTLSELDREGANGFLKMAAQMKESGQKIDDDTRTLASNILNSFNNLPEDLDEAGKNALLGLIYGLEDQIPELQNKSEMSADQIVDSIKAYLGISSPSKVLQEVGNYAIDGLVLGMEKGQKSIPRVSQKIVQAIVKAFQSGNSSFKSIGSKISELISQGIASGSPKISAIIAKLITMSASAFRAGYSELYNASSYMALGAISGFNSQAENLKASVVATMRETAQAARNELKIKSPSKVFAEIGANIAKGVIKGVDDNKANVKKSATELSKLYIDAANNRLRKLKSNNKITKAQEVTFWREIAKATKKGTASYNTAVKNMASAKTALQKEVGSLSKTFANDVKKISTTLEKDIKKVNDDLKKNIEDLRNAYSESVKTREEGILGSLDLFDRVNLDDVKSRNTIVSALKNQVDTLREWDDVLDNLRGRIKNENFLTELESQGVESLDTLKNINKMSDKELAEYEALYAERARIVNERAITENKKLLDDTNRQISALQAQAEKDIDKLQTTADKQITKLKETYMKNLAKLGVDTHKKGKDIGNNIAKGIQSGFSEAMKEVTKATKNEMNALLNSIKKQLKIKSPSKVFAGIGGFMAQGIGVGFVGEMRSVNRDIRRSLPSVATSNMLNGLNSGLNAGSVSNSTMNRNMNFTQNIYAPKQPSRIELYRQTRNLLALAERGA